MCFKFSCLGLEIYLAYVSFFLSTSLIYAMICILRAELMFQ
jgi:hypothetical protein